MGFGADAFATDQHRCGDAVRRLGALGMRVDAELRETQAQRYARRERRDVMMQMRQFHLQPLTAGGMRFTADQVVGRGEAVPMSSNDTVEGRQDNRRVVVIVTPQ